jgi:dihydroorotase-like cyclic amidohydrolase
MKEGFLMRTLLKGGSVVSGSGAKQADVLIENEKVVAVGRNLKAEADRTVDVEGCLLFPGFIDAHTHFDLDVCNTTTADDFYTGSRAALKGGTTTVIDFSTPNKGETLQFGLDEWHRKADGKTLPPSPISVSSSRTTSLSAMPEVTWKNRSRWNTSKASSTALPKTVFP